MWSCCSFFGVPLSVRVLGYQAPMFPSRISHRNEEGMLFAMLVSVMWLKGLSHMNRYASPQLPLSEKHVTLQNPRPSSTTTSFLLLLLLHLFSIMLVKSNSLTSQSHVETVLYGRLWQRCQLDVDTFLNELHISFQSRQP